MRTVYTTRTGSGLYANSLLRRTHTTPDVSKFRVRSLLSPPAAISYNHAAAILTYRIRNMWQHMTSRQHRKDVASKRRLRFLVYQRARTLKYLKRVDRVRYDIALQRMGLEPGSVEGELMV